MDKRYGRKIQCQRKCDLGRKKDNAICTDREIDEWFPHSCINRLRIFEVDKERKRDKDKERKSAQNQE